MIWKLFTVILIVTRIVTENIGTFNNYIPIQVLTFKLVCNIINKYQPSIRRAVKMSLVRYTNKKTGVVTVYESTSHYDPETKRSRPIRKYLGVEDPNTGKIIPSSGKPGRKKLLDIPMRRSRKTDVF